jgi:uncharacterized protein (DUF39 family)
MKIRKTYAEINEKIRSGDAFVVTAEEMIKIVEENGEVEAASQVDVVTTGTFAPMCSSGAFINFGHTKPKIKASVVYLNNVLCYGGIAAVDCFIGATQVSKDDPLNYNFPGEFRYGGGHVIEDLIAGKEVHIIAEGYGTDCYPRKYYEATVTINDLRNAFLYNPRNCYQNYNAAINLSSKTIYTYMGVLKPNGTNINFCSAGQLSPLLNDPFYKTIGTGTKIFLGGAVGVITWQGTQHNPYAPRSANGVVKEGAGTIAVTGDMKEMDSKWIKGVSILGYGCSMSVGVGIPIPILNEEMARFTGVSDGDIYAPVVDYGTDYPNKEDKVLAQVTYGELKSGSIKFNGNTVNTFPLSSYKKAKEIAEILKSWIKYGEFTIGEPQIHVPTVRS